MSQPLSPEHAAPGAAASIPGLITPGGITPATYAAPPTGASITNAPDGAATVQVGTATSAPDGYVAPVTPATTATPTVAPAPVPPPVAPDQPPADGDRGWPANTPLEQMTTEQRESYWRYHSRKWEDIAKSRQDYDALKAAADELTRLKAANATEAEKAVAAARAAGYAEASGKAATVLVDAHVRAGLMSRLAPHQVDALVTTLDHRYFLAPDGFSVDAEKVTAFVNAVAPASAAMVQPGMVAPQAAYAAAAMPTTVPPAAPPPPATGLPRALPDMGQGTPATSKPSGLEAGRAMARQMFGDRTQRS